MITAERDQTLHAVVRDGITRTIGAIGLTGVALIHTIDAPGHFTGGPDTYLGVMYVCLVVACLALAAALVIRGDRQVWLATSGLTASAITGYILSRTVGLPGNGSDIGNWAEGLGIASLFTEGSLLALCAVALTLPDVAPITRLRGRRA